MPTNLYHVAPRYTPGSPAQVDFETAWRVAREERAAYAARDRREQADAGLQGIVYATLEYGGHVHVRDEITGEWFAVPAKEWRGAHWYERSDRTKYLTAVSEVAS